MGGRAAYGGTCVFGEEVPHEYRLSDGPRLTGVWVLVVDDMRSVQQRVTDILGRAGATVTAVGSADEALEVLQRERPNVLLSNLSMPGKGGSWLIGQVRALR